MVWASPAFAAQRWAAPSATGSGDCSSAANACTLQTAIGGSMPSDEVIVQPGDYTVSSEISTTGKALLIHGEDGMPLPRLHGGANGNMFGLASGTTLRQLALDASPSTGSASLLIGTNLTLDAIYIKDTATAPGVTVTGILDLGGGTSIIRNTAVFVNGTNASNALHASSSNLILRGDTFVTAAGDAVDYEVVGVGSLDAKSVIARASTGNSDFFVNGSSATAVIRYSNFGACTTSSGATCDSSDPSNVTDPPTFVDQANGDLHESPTSSTIDRGTVDAYSGTTDLDGNPRSLGLGPDMGAYERVPARLYASPSGVGDCSQAGPCTLQQAMSSAHQDDLVIVGPGQYTITSTLPVRFGINIQGQEGGPLPDLVFALPTGADGFSLEGYATLTRLKLSRSVGTGNVVEVDGANVVLDAVDIEDSSNQSHCVNVDDGPLTLRNSLLHMTGSQSAAVYSNGPSMHLRGDTLIAPSNDSDGVDEITGSGTASVDVRSTIVRAGNHDFDVQSGAPGTTTVTVDHSNYQPNHIVVGGTGTAQFVGNGDPTNQLSVDPKFVDAAAGNFREAPGSPTIDAGVADALSGTNDLDGNPRTLGAAPDIGAYEFVPQTAGTTHKPAEPRLHHRINRGKHTAKFTFTDSAATGFQCALIKFRFKHGHKQQAKPRFKSCKSPKTYKHLAAGSYAFEVRASNRAGTGPTVAFKFKI
jgi:hypothetical protein